MRSQPFYRIILSSFFIFLIVFACSEREDPILDTNIAIELTNQSYGNHPRQVFDIFLPANRNKSSTRLFVWVHGGGWIDGSKDEFREFKPWLEAVQEDYAYASINYRLFDLLTASNRFPNQEEDVKLAMDYFKSQLDQWNISDQVILAGASAGGHLVLLHSYKNNPDKFVKTVVAFFPPTDLLEFRSFNVTTRFLLDNLMGGPPDQSQSLYESSSPVNFVTNTSIPTVLFHGDQDVVVPISQSEILESLMKEKSVSHLIKYIPGQGHGFTENTYRELIEETEKFINLQLP